MIRNVFPALLLPALLTARAQEAPKPADPAAPGAKTEAAPKPYAKVVTPEFKSFQGLFKVHQSGSKVLFEIPKAELGKDLLLVVRVKQSPDGSNAFPGFEVASHVLRFETRDQKVLLRILTHYNVAQPGTPMGRAVAAMNSAPILMALPVETTSAQGDPVVDMTKLFTGDIPEINVKTVVGGGSLDASRTFLEKARAYPLNVNIEALQTFGATALNDKRSKELGRPSQGNLPRTALVHYSFLKLPEKPMMPRYRDERVGFFSHNFLPYDRNDISVRTEQMIARFRLEKKDPKAAKSEPVKPIVFYVDPNTPTQWVPWVKKAVEAWQPSFEEAGFLNAIQCKEAPKDDPDWSAEDARYSVIRWVPSATPNARGPHIADPRSGESLQAHVEIYSNVLQLATTWYVAQAGPLDPRVKELPLSEEVLGPMLQFVITHEVGHSLGLQHNFKASANYPLEKLRDRAWLEKMGHVPSIMDYARLNYVVQPEDKIPPSLLVPKIGPYDRFAIHWGYAPIPEAATPEAERATLNAWCQEQKTTPWLRFSTDGAKESDPGEETEAVGDSDPVKATALGIKNLKRVMAMLPSLALKPGEGYENLHMLHQRVLNQFNTEAKHVANLIGGYDSEPKMGTDPGVRFQPVSKARQQEAVKFLCDEFFKTPTWLVDGQILRKLQPKSGMETFITMHIFMMSDLLKALDPLQDHELILGAKAYTASQFLADMRAGIFSELKGGAPKVDGFRRNTQRAWVEQVQGKLKFALASMQVTDARSVLRAELVAIRQLVAGKARTAGDAATRAHLADIREGIDRTLNPSAAQAGAPPTAPKPEPEGHVSTEYLN